MLVAKRDGLMSVVTLIPNPSQPASVERIDIAVAARVTLPCCLCLVGPEHVFVGSRMGDSQLLAYSYVDGQGRADNTNADGGESVDIKGFDKGDEEKHTHRAKRARMPLPAIGDDVVSREEEDFFLYGGDDGSSEDAQNMHPGSRLATATEVNGPGPGPGPGPGRGASSVDKDAGASTKSAPPQLSLSPSTAVPTVPTISASAAGIAARAAAVAAGDVSNTGGVRDTGVRLRAVDWLESRATGPCVSAALGNIHDVYTDEFELLVAAGKDKCGALYKVSG